MLAIMLILPWFLTKNTACCVGRVMPNTSLPPPFLKKASHLVLRFGFSRPNRRRLNERRSWYVKCGKKGCAVWRHGGQWVRHPFDFCKQHRPQQQLPIPPPLKIVADLCFWSNHTLANGVRRGWNVRCANKNCKRLRFQATFYSTQYRLCRTCRSLSENPTASMEVVPKTLEHLVISRPDPSRGGHQHLVFECSNHKFCGSTIGRRALAKNLPDLKRYLHNKTKIFCMKCRGPERLIRNNDGVDISHFKFSSGPTRIRCQGVGCQRHIEFRPSRRALSAHLCAECWGLSQQKYLPFSSLLNYLNESARKRNIRQDMTLYEIACFAAIRECFYCREKIKTLGGNKITLPLLMQPNARSKRNRISAGLDRMNSLKGYSIDNCIPCCRSCNWVKLHLLSVRDMMSYMAVRQRNKAVIKRLTTMTERDALKDAEIFLLHKLPQAMKEVDAAMRTNLSRRGLL